MSTRKADPKSFARVVIMQRLHKDDLAGRCISEGYTHLMLPMQYDPARACVTKFGGDRRIHPGELLHPDRFPADVVAMMRRELTERIAQAQLDQNPQPEAGAIFHREWFGQRWTKVPNGAIWIQSWDCAFKGEDDSDWVVGECWAGVNRANFFLVDQIRARMELPETCQAMIDFSAKWPKARAKLVENKANGPAVEQTLRKKVPGIILVEPQGGKVARANAVTPFFEAGNVWLPEAPWVHDYVEEMCAFPMGSADDQVDATSQALLRLAGGARPNYQGAMAQVAKG